jgi:hypothetical protein
MFFGNPAKIYVNILDLIANSLFMRIQVHGSYHV